MSLVYTKAKDELSGMKKQYNFRLEESLVKDLQTVADIENRSLTNLIETVMMQYVKERLPDKKKKK